MSVYKCEVCGSSLVSTNTMYVNKNFPYFNCEVCSTIYESNIETNDDMLGSYKLTFNIFSNIQKEKIK